MTETHSKRNEIKTQALLWPDFKKSIPAGRPIIGIDYGMKRIGVALSDKEHRAAYPFKIIARLKELDDIVASREAGAFVVGLPLQTDGQEGAIVHSVHLFVARLIEKYGLPVFLMDERYTSKQAEYRLKSSYMSDKKLAKRLDAEAAAVILQRALDKLCLDRKEKA